MFCLLFHLKRPECLFAELLVDQVGQNFSSDRGKPTEIGGSLIKIDKKTVSIKEVANNQILGANCVGKKIIDLPRV